MRGVTDEAIVLGLMDYREADIIVTLFCRSHGKVAAVARGARRSRKRFGGALELFASLQVNFEQKEGLSILGETDIVTIYPGIRGEFAAIAHAGYACELVAAFMPEHHSNSRLFRLLTAYLEHLDTGAAEPSDRHFFEMNMLNILGYRPPLEGCQVCGAPLAENGCCWSAEGCYCGACSQGRQAGIMGASTIVLLLQSLKTGRFSVVRFSDEERREVECFLDACIAANLQRPLKSLSFLRLSP